MSTTLAWLTAFVWTLAIELPIYAVVLRGRTARWWAPLALALLANSVTHPVFSLWLLRCTPALPAVVCAELCIALLEAAIAYAGSGPSRAWPRALAAAAAANGASFVFGLLAAPR